MFHENQMFEFLKNLELYQIAVTAIAVLMIYQGTANYIKGKSGQTFLKFFVRIIIWGGMGALALFPNFSNVLAQNIGIKGNVNAVVFTGFVLIFLIIFKLLSAIEKLEQQLSILTRKDALKEIKNDREK